MGNRTRINLLSQYFWSVVLRKNAVPISLTVTLIIFFLFDFLFALGLILLSTSIFLIILGRSDFFFWSIRVFFPTMLLFCILYTRTRLLSYPPIDFPKKIKIQIEVQEISSHTDRFKWYTLRGILVDYLEKDTPLKVNTKKLRISLRCKKPFSSIKVGAQYKVTCILRASKKYFAVSTISNPESMILVDPYPNKLTQIKHNSISWIQSQISHLGKAYGLTLSLICGDRSHLSFEIKNQFLSSGTFHLLAVSGLHLGMVWGFFVTILKRFTSLKTSQSLSLILCLPYIVINAFRPPILRAYFMLLIGTILSFLDKGYSLLHLVLFCLISLLLWNPDLSKDVGFQFSFAGTLGIALSILWCQKKTTWNLLQKSLWVSFFAQMWVTPLEIYYFGKIHPLSFINSCIVSPFIFFLLGLGLCNVVLPIKEIQWGLSFLSKILLYCLQKVLAILLYLPQEINATRDIKNWATCIILFGYLVIWSMWIHKKILQQNSKQTDVLVKW